MKDIAFTVSTLLFASIASQACTQQAEKTKSETEAMGAAGENLANAGQDAENATREAMEAAKVAVMAAKLAVYSQVQEDREAAAQMASNAEAAAIKAQTDIKIANAQIDAELNENARKAEELAEKAVAMTRDASRKTVESVKAGTKPDLAAAKAAALEAQKSLIKAATATADVGKAAALAGEETWDREMDGARQEP